MPRPQSAICPESGTYGVFITLMLKAGREQTVRSALSALPALTETLAREQEEPVLSSAAGIGADAWGRLFPIAKPDALTPFQAQEDGSRRAPATPADLFLHIHSNRQSANFALALRMMRLLGDSVVLVEEIHGFKTLGKRDLTGFVDGTENPEGVERAEVALVGAKDPVFAQGSYVSIQRYVHDLPLWEQYPLSRQEGVIGRTKDGDVELEDAVKPPTAHIARVVMEENGEELEILRQSMPYGTTSENGLYFIAYGKTPDVFFKMLARMVRRDGLGHYDHLLDVTRAVTGASFFVPSVELLESLGRLESV